MVEPLPDSYAELKEILKPLIQWWWRQGFDGTMMIKTILDGVEDRMLQVDGREEKGPLNAAGWELAAELRGDCSYWPIGNHDYR
jgi:hypothetical protein